MPRLPRPSRRGAGRGIEDPIDQICRPSWGRKLVGRAGHGARLRVAVSVWPRADVAWGDKTNHEQGRGTMRLCAGAQFCTKGFSAWARGEGARHTKGARLMICARELPIAAVEGQRKEGGMLAECDCIARRSQHAHKQPILGPPLSPLPSPHAPSPLRQPHSPLPLAVTAACSCRRRARARLAPPRAASAAGRACCSGRSSSPQWSRPAG